MKIQVIQLHTTKAEEINITALLAGVQEIMYIRAGKEDKTRKDELKAAISALVLSAHALSLKLEFVEDLEWQWEEAARKREREREQREDELRKLVGEFPADVPF